MFAHTLAVHDQAVFLQAESEFLGLLMLTFFDNLILKLRHMSALETYHVVVMVSTFQFKHGMATLEMVAFDQTSSLELGQHTVNRGKADIVLGIH